MIRGNPEFVKNVKLEFSLMRFVTALVLLFLMIWIGWGNVAKVHWNSLYTLEQLKAKSLFSWLCGFGFLFSIIWGTYLVTNNLLEEMKIKTWDFVRMSSLSPIKILTGKMFGAASLVWIVTSIFVMPSIFYTVTKMLPGDGIVRSEIITVSVLMVCLISWIILSYSLTLLTGLVEGTQNRGGGFSGTFLVFLLGIAVGMQIIGSFNPFHSIERYGKIASPSGKPPRLIELPGDAFIVKPDFSYISKPDMSGWYGFDLYHLDILAMALVFFCLWTFAGAWRTLRKSLQYHDAPWVWLIFIVTASVFMNGFDALRIDSLRPAQSAYFWPLFISGACMFFTCVSEAGNTVKYRSFSQKISARLYYEAFREMPLWMISFAAFFVCILLNLIVLGHSKEAVLFFISLMGFTMRDILAFHAISWAPNARRPLVGLVVYMAILYGLLPTIANLTDKNSMALFFPLVGDKAPDFYWLLLAAEISIPGYFFMKRWKGAFGPKEVLLS